MTWQDTTKRAQVGVATVEQLVLLLCVAIGFGTALLALGPALVRYHNVILQVLSLPVP